MQSAKALQIKGLSGGNSEEKISEFASYLAQQQQQQQQQQLQQQLQQQQYQPQPQQQLQQPITQKQWQQALFRLTAARSNDFPPNVITISAATSACEKC